MHLRRDLFRQLDVPPHRGRSRRLNTPSQNTDAGATCPSVNPTMPGAGQGSLRITISQIPGMTEPRERPRPKAGIEPRPASLESDDSTTRLKRQSQSREECLQEGGGRGGGRRIINEGCGPEWYISSMLYSRDIPFWSGTLELFLYYPDL